MAPPLAPVAPRRRPMRSMAARAVLAVLLAVTLGACTSRPEAKPAASPRGPALAGTLRIAADSALQAAFDQLVTGFERAHPSVAVTPTYTGTQALTTILQRGAAADVVAVAGGGDALVTAGLVVSGTAKQVARDPLVIAVARGNPLGLTSLAALSGRGVRIALVDPSLPLGAAAQQALALAGVRLAKPTVELTASQVVADVVSGTADAGLVAASDVAPGGAGGGEGQAVTAVALPPADGVVTDYTIAPLSSAVNPSAASAFIAYALSPAGQQILQSAGFSAP